MRETFSASTISSIFFIQMLRYRSDDPFFKKRANVFFRVSNFSMLRPFRCLANRRVFSSYRSNQRKGCDDPFVYFRFPAVDYRLFLSSFRILSIRYCWPFLFAYLPFLLLLAPCYPLVGYLASLSSLFPLRYFSFVLFESCMYNGVSIYIRVIFHADNNLFPSR